MRAPEVIKIFLPVSVGVGCRNKIAQAGGSATAMYPSRFQRLDIRAQGPGGSVSGEHAPPTADGLCVLPRPSGRTQGKGAISLPLLVRPPVLLDQGPNPTTSLNLIPPEGPVCKCSHTGGMASIYALGGTTSQSMSHHKVERGIPTGTQFTL